MNSPVAKLNFSGIRLVAFDIDGVFTDGRFYLSNDGVESKAFHTQDGYGVRALLKSGVHVAVISGRSSAAVLLRMKELGVPHVILGCDDKVAAFESLRNQLNVDRSATAFVGDDIPDLPVLKIASIAIAVANAVDEVRDYCDYTTSATGGCGAVREICDLIRRANIQ